LDLPREVARLVGKSPYRRRGSRQDRGSRPLFLGHAGLAQPGEINRLRTRQRPLAPHNIRAVH
jgi:hypothetical protein